MLIISFNSFIIYIKFIFCFYIIKKRINNELKKNFIYYSIVDIINSIIIKLFLYIPNKQFDLFYVIFYNFGVIFLFWQLYSFYSIINIIINNNKKKINYLFLLLFFTSGVIKLIIKIIFYINKKTPFQFIHIISQSKSLFFFQFICYLLFQFFYIIPTIIQSGIYLKEYKVYKLFKKSLCFLLSLFFIKIIIETFQIGFLEFFKILIQDNAYFRKLIAKDSDTIFTIISIFSTSIYIYIIYFIRIIKNITTANHNYSYLKDQSNNILELSITKKNIERIFIENNSLKNLIHEFCIENIKNKYNLNANMFEIIDKNNELYTSLFNENSLFYQEINLNKLIYYDFYYDMYHANLLMENNKNFKNKFLKTILDILDKFNIRLIIPVYQSEKINNYFIFSQSTFTLKKNFNENDFKYLFSLIKYLNDSSINLMSNSFYSKLIYENKVAELNLLENNKIHENNFKKLNDKIKQIEQIFIYENNKQNIKSFTKQQSILINENLNFIHKNKKIEDKFSNNLDFIFHKFPNNELTILSSEKINLNFYTGSMHSIFPFFKKQNEKIEFILENNKINSILQIEFKEMAKHIEFFNSFYNDYNIKIIINKINHAKSFYKIISYVSQSECIYVSLKNINNIESIENIFYKLLKSANQYYIFFTYINEISSQLQKKIIEIYLKNFIENNNTLIKIFFIINEEKDLSLINNEIITMSKIIILEKIIIKNINQNNLSIILTNYSNYILKKNYSTNIIQLINTNYYNQKSKINFYTFLDFFEKIIYFYSLNISKINNSNEFYINEATKLEKKALKNIFLMDKIGNIFNFNFEKIATLLNTSKSTINKYYKNNFPN